MVLKCKRYFYCAGESDCNLTDENNRPNSKICWFSSNDTDIEYEQRCVFIADDILKTTIFQLNFNCDEPLEPKSVCNIECLTKEKFKKSQLWMCFVVMGLGIG